MVDVLLKLIKYKGKAVPVFNQVSHYEDVSCA